MVARYWVPCAMDSAKLSGFLEMESGAGGSFRRMGWDRLLGIETGVENIDGGEESEEEGREVHFK
jgi:hypothetical protein